jgi:large subunit ribosomal protein L15
MRFDGTDPVTPERLQAAGLLKSAAMTVKILGQGTLSAALTVEAHAFSRSAKEKIEAAGGKAIVIAAPSKVDRQSVRTRRV